MILIANSCLTMIMVQNAKFYCLYRLRISLSTIHTSRHTHMVIGILLRSIFRCSLSFGMISQKNRSRKEGTTNAYTHGSD